MKDGKESDERECFVIPNSGSSDSEVDFKQSPQYSFV